MKRILTFGEMLLRFSPSDHKLIIQPNTNSLDMFYGGAEANVAVAISSFGGESGFITRLPDNPLGHKGIRYLRQYGVNVSHIMIGGERMGLYFLESGYSVRASNVIYDRKYSSFSEMEMSDEEMERALKDYDILFLSGITLAINENTFALSLRLVKKAKEMGKEVIFDCNYRSRLISLEEAGRKYREILPYVDILFAGYLDFINIFGLEYRLPKDEEDLKEYYCGIYDELYKGYSFKFVVSSIRRAVSSSVNMYSGVMTDGKKVVKGKEFEIEIKDRVGSGDAFTSGVIYCYLEERDMQYMIDFAVGSGALKHTLLGDISEFNKEKVIQIIISDSFDVVR